MSLRHRPVDDGSATPSNPPVTVVMPVRDVASTVAAQLEALAAQTYGGWWELVVVDNGSRDETVAVVRTWDARMPRLRIVEAAVAGVATARNAGASAARGDLLLFCDGDDVVAHDWIAAMAAAAGRGDLIGGRLDVERLNTPLVRAWRSSLTETGLPTPLGLWPHVIGANFAVWRDVYLAVGGCDQAFRGGGDDVDLSWRIHLAGATIVFAPDAVVHYRLRPDLRSTGRQLGAYGAGAALLYRNFRAHGAQRPPLAGTAKHWARLLQRAPRMLVVAEERGIWVADASYQWGRLRGALHHRVLFW